jgi:site-specific recombinase XerD
VIHRVDCSALCAFLADQATLGKRASTLGRRLAAVRYFHRAAGYETPTSDEKVKTVLSGLRRTIGAAPVRKRAATADIVIAISPTATSLRALRNRAIILLGFAGAFRRSELVALNVDDLTTAGSVYNISFAVIGGLTPLVAAWLVNRTATRSRRRS